jgi:hypothetical protein
MKKLVAILALTAALIVGSAASAFANPGPGNSNQCAPGQQGNQDPAFKPGSCDNK